MRIISTEPTTGGWTLYKFDDGAWLAMTPDGRVPRTLNLVEPLTTYKKVIQENRA